MSTVQSLPHWDMSTIYPGLNSPEFDQGFAGVRQDIEDLARLFDTYGIEGRTGVQIDDVTVATFEKVLQRYNAVIEETLTLSVYITCFVTTNSQDTLAQARLSELQQSSVILAKLETRFAAWIGSLDVDALMKQSSIAQAHSFFLKKTNIRATHLMSAVEEDLATELDLSGGTAWEKLHGDVTSRLVVAIEIDGEKQELPMSVMRGMAADGEREKRRRAYEAELEAWKGAAVPLAAALNSIKGEVNTLTRRRGWESPLAASLFSSNIDQETLEAMLTAARESFPDFRRYLRAKARALGLERLAWYDLLAPLGKESRVWTYGEAQAFIIEQFGTYSKRLASFAERAFRENWIDAEPRVGKMDGGYCTPLRRDESRVFLNYRAAFDGVSTLAHELGHAYHNLNLAQRTILQRSTPMTLAETASIFCETIIRNAALQKADRQEQLAILEALLEGSCQVVVDITSRFLFEQRVFERRKQRELAVEELNAIMLETQRETYGDGLDETALHPYMWAVKPHYYSSQVSFYNYPYMFGLLFGLGLYARYQQDGEQFKHSYDELLSSTGLADAATLAGRFGIDLHSLDFWRASFAIIRENVDTFEELTK